MVIEGRCTTEEAAELLRLSRRRHVLRLKKGLREEGPEALAHGNRGRKPAHAIRESEMREVLDLAGTLYAGYNHTHLHEQLVAEQGIRLSRRSVARILTGAGMRSPRRRRARRHRARRERLPKEGMLLQVDGSRHDWLEGRGQRLVLVGAVDDATGELVHALFREQEDAQGYLTLLREVVRKRGVPLAWYSDRHGIFVRNDKEPWTLTEESAGRREPTQVARALEELGVNLILARTPQAKGRVERCWGTLQDRRVKELRRANADTLAEANQALKRYLPRFKERFARPPADPEPAYRRWPKGRTSTPPAASTTRAPWPMTTLSAWRSDSYTYRRAPVGAATPAAVSNSRSGWTARWLSSTRAARSPISRPPPRPPCAPDGASAVANSPGNSSRNSSNCSPRPHRQPPPEHHWLDQRQTTPGADRHAAR